MESPNLADQVRRTLAEADGFDFGKLEPHDYRKQAEAVVSLITAGQPDGDPVVAHREPESRHIHCTDCRLDTDSVSLVSADLPGGGVCCRCRTDVLISRKSAPPTARIAALREAAAIADWIADMADDERFRERYGQGNTILGARVVAEGLRRRAEKLESGR